MGNQIIMAMQNGDKKAIMSGLNCQGAIYRMNAIAFAVLNKMTSNDIVQKIIYLKEDTVSFDGYTVSDFAVAALDVLEIEKYPGSDSRIISLIDSKFKFLR